jgi:hypothetical protein
MTRQVSASKQVGQGRTDLLQGFTLPMLRVHTLLRDAAARLDALPLDADGHRLALELGCATRAIARPNAGAEARPVRGAEAGATLRAGRTWHSTYAGADRLIADPEHRRCSDEGLTALDVGARTRLRAQSLSRAACNRTAPARHCARRDRRRCRAISVGTGRASGTGATRNQRAVLTNLGGGGAAAARAFRARRRRGGIAHRQIAR